MALSGKGCREKGHNFERLIVNYLKELGYEAVTSRAESRNMDDKGVDLIDNTDYYFQCKAVERIGSIHDIIESMPQDKIRVVLHKRKNKGILACMYFDDFVETNLK